MTIFATRSGATRCISIILGLLLVLSIYTGYRRLMADFHYQRAYAASRHGLWGITLQNGVESVKYNPYDRRPYYEIGFALLEMGAGEAAEREIQKYLAQYPHAPNAHHNLRIARRR